ncbi:DUF4238 domain-containing protein [Halomonas elongata]|uniref:DUF4238 domain-containing protein n=1 Tax=Halomonas elongata TaxID=2746 RepID=UPI00335553B4
MHEYREWIGIPDEHRFVLDESKRGWDTDRATRSREKCGSEVHGTGRVVEKMKNNEFKRNNHYVWSFYLKGWSPEKNNVWYLSKKKKSVKDSARGLACQRDFYKLRRLEDCHVEIIQAFSKLCASHLRDEHDNILRPILLFREAEKELKRSGRLSKEFDREYRKFRQNYFEEIHTYHESLALPVMQQLRHNPILVSRDDVLSPEFLSFVGHQVTRTKKFRDVVEKFFDESSVKGVAGVDADLIDRTRECSMIQTFLLGENIGKSIFLSKGNYSVTLLKNASGDPFITSDNPVINISPKAKVCENGTPEKFDIYYPVSPQYALVIHETGLFDNATFEVGGGWVDKLNIDMARNSDAHIFCDNKESIERYKKYV